MTFTIELSPDLGRRLQELADERGRTADELLRQAVERMVGDSVPVGEPNREAMALLDQWLAEEPDLEEAEGYPVEITPLSLREISVE
jgi:predicted transcriptional regulator